MGGLDECYRIKYPVRQPGRQDGGRVGFIAPPLLVYAEPWCSQAPRSAFSSHLRSFALRGASGPTQDGWLRHGGMEQSDRGIGCWGRVDPRTGR